MTTTAVSRRSTRNDSKLPAEWTVPGSLSSAMLHHKSIVRDGPCSDFRRSEMLNADRDAACSRKCVVRPTALPASIRARLGLLERRGSI